MTSNQSINCPYCTVPLEVDSETSYAACLHCGTIVRIERQKEQWQGEIEERVNRLDVKRSVLHGLRCSDQANDMKLDEIWRDLGGHHQSKWENYAIRIKAYLTGRFGCISTSLYVVLPLTIFLMAGCLLGSSAGAFLALIIAVLLVARFAKPVLGWIVRKLEINRSEAAAARNETVAMLLAKIDGLEKNKKRISDQIKKTKREIAHLEKWNGGLGPVVSGVLGRMPFQLLREMALIFVPPQKFELLPRVDWRQYDVSSMASLLLSAAWPMDREQWVQKQEYDLPIELLQPWIVCADLCRVRSMHFEVAQVLAMSELVDSVQSLARANKEALTRFVQDQCKAYNLAHSPTEEEIEQLIARARKTHARLIWNISDAREFRSTLEAKYNRHLTLDLYDTFNLLKVLFAVLLASFICYCCMSACLLLIGPGVEKPLYFLGLAGFVGFVCEMTLLIAVTFGYPYWLSWLLDVHFVHKLSQERNTRIIFMALNARNQDWIYAITQKYFPLLMQVSALVFLVVIGFLPMFSISFNKPLLYFTMSIIVLMVSLLVVPEMYFLKKDLPGIYLSPRALSRYMFFKLVTLGSGLLRFVIFYYSVLGLLAWHKLVVTYVLAPLYFDPAKAIDYMGAFAIQNWQLELGSVIVQIIILSLGLLALLYFLLPYLILRKFKETILFVLLAITASYTEKYTAIYLDRFFNFPAGAVFTIVILLGIVVFNAAIFETLEAVTDPGTDETSLKLCKSCFKFVWLDAKFCPYCGKNEFQEDNELRKILALKVKGITNRMALELIDRFGDIHSLRQRSIADFEKIEGIGSKRAKALYTALRNRQQ